ncbi:MAG: DMT family transporter [Halopseudomonas sp.]
MSPLHKQTLEGGFFGLLAAAIWSGHSPVSALGIAAGFESTDLAAIRIATSSILLLPYLLTRRQGIWGALTWPRAMLLAACAGAPFSLIQIAGLNFAPLSHSAAISLGAVPLFASALGLAFLGSRLTPLRGLALVSLLAGMLLMVSGGDGRNSDFPQAWRGDFCFAVAALLWALYAFLGQRWRVPPLTGVALSSVLSVPYLLVYALALRPKIPEINSTELASAGVTIDDLVLQVVYQGVLIGALAIYSYSRAVTLLGLEKGALFTALAPVGVMLIGTRLLDQQPMPIEWLAITLVTAGMLAGMLISRPTPHPSKNSSNTLEGAVRQRE